jgi:RNA polymerase sigma factor (sigma-70 family)
MRPISRYRLAHDGSRPLPAAELAALVTRYRTSGDRRIERRLVEANLRLVLTIARDFARPGGPELDDLIQEGMLGLVEAVRRFDPTKGASLPTYAGYWIRAFISKFLMENVRIVRVVRTRAQRAAFYRGEIEGGEVSLEASVSREAQDRARTLHERLADPHPGADEQLATAELAQRALAAVERLKPRLQPRDVTILSRRMLAETPRSCRAIGAQLALSGERVRQIEDGLRTWLRRQLSEGPLAAAA